MKTNINIPQLQKFQYFQENIANITQTPLIDFSGNCINHKIYNQQIQQIKKRQKKLELKTLLNISSFLIKKIPKILKQDVEKNQTIINPHYKYQLPGNPIIRYKFKKKLKKKLLIQRIRKKYKYIMLQQNLSLHTFMGTKEVSYASLVKNNKLDLIKFLYKRTSKNYKEKTFIKRPFKISKMNQARFDKIDLTKYALWYKKMEDQLFLANQYPVING